MINIAPGACVMQNSGLAWAMAAGALYRPRTQATRRAELDGVAIVGSREVGNADARRVAKVHRRAMRRESARVTCTARIASWAENGRMLTTIGPWKRPAASVCRFVWYMATFLPCCTWQRQAGVHQQRLLERERAANDEGHQVIAPEVPDVGGLAD